MSLPQNYTKLRTGKFFLFSLCVFCAVWVLWNILPDHLHFDDQGFGRLTLGLSIEASIAASFIIAANEKEAAKNLKRDLYLLQLMEAVHALLKKGEPVGVGKPDNASACPGLETHERET